jgi:predicted Rossmann fold flavoprotein
MFPITDSSDTIVNCLMKAAAEAGVELRTRCGLEELAQNAAGKWIATLSDRQQISATHVLVATGGCRSGNLPAVLEAIGHKIEPPVPSLFTFHVNVPWVQELAGLSVPLAEAAVPGTRLKEKGPLLFTHWGVSGPCVLRLSAWGARELAALNYEFPLTVKWAPDANPESVAQAFQKAREMHPGKTVTNLPLLGIPARLWSALAACAGVGPDERWAQLRKAESTALSDQILRTEIPVTGKSLHKDEFVTCGGVSIKEVDFRTLESRLKKGLHFAGEVLDVDGITGGFNFQAAWTTGWLAGKAIAAAEAAPA